MRSLLFDAGIDAHARHFLSRELVRVFAPKSTDMCQQNADGELLPFVLVGWDRMDAVAFPGKVPRCLRVHIFEADPHQHRLWGQSNKYRFTRAELQRHIRWEGVGVGSYELQRTSYGWHRGVVQSSVVPASERLAAQRVFMAHSGERYDCFSGLGLGSAIPEKQCGMAHSGERYDWQAQSTVIIVWPQRQTRPRPRQTARLPFAALRAPIRCSW